MESSAQFLYHSFPRRGGGKLDHQKALKILESVFQSGLLLTPETYSFHEELSDGSSGPEIIVVQNRVCFTQIPESGLSSHAKFFGDVSLEFTVNELQRAHACPIFYLPQDSKDKVWRGAFGAFLSRLTETHQLLERLQDCFELSRDTTRSEETLNFNKNGDSYPTGIKMKDLHHFLTFINSGGQPFIEQLGVIKGFSSLFYPIENTTYTEKLGYYMQREWRIISNIIHKGNALVDKLTVDEQNRLLDLDKEYYDKIVTIPTGTFRRVELCKVLRTIGGKPIQASINRIFVPHSIYSETKDLLKKYNLEIELSTQS